jgi:putative oxidoreductase
VSGLPASVDLFTRVDVPFAQVSAYIVRTFELVGGIMVLLGLGVRWLGIWFIFEFLYTFFMVKMPRQGWDAARIDFMMLAGALLIFLAGAGAPSLDAWLQRRRTVDQSSDPVSTA